VAAVNEELVGFVRDALRSGVSREGIADGLYRAGWSREQVHAALSSFADVEFPIPIPRPRASVEAREAFLYLVLFTTLYISAYQFGSLVFQFIEQAFPDAADRTFGVVERLRWSVSSLVVAFPVFLFLSRLTAREVDAAPARRQSPVRRWLTYLTLFVAAAVLIGDVTTLLYNLLGGDLTARFVLKVLVVGLIAGAIFWYYLSDLRADERSPGADTS